MEKTVTNKQQMELGGIQNINVSCKDTNVALFNTDTSSLIIKEYKSFGRSKGSFNIVKSGDAINITDGKCPLFFGALKYTTEIYLPKTFAGNITLKIGTGNVQLNDSFTFDSLAVECSDGYIRVINVTAQKIKLQSSAGKIQCGTINGDIEIHTKDGGIFISQLSGNIIANAKSGKIQCTVVKPREKIVLTAGDGGIILNIPKDLHFRFSAKTGSRIKAPFINSLFRPVTDNNTYQGVIGGENKPRNEAVDIILTAKDYRIAVNWID
ncbi:MAG: DUF4097 domain-containing protein [Firmicutes bacterium]|nr:DUF4097 domain-containing protein [Bacillota bacterium]